MAFTRLQTPAAKPKGRGVLLCSDLLHFTILIRAGKRKVVSDSDDEAQIPV